MENPRAIDRMAAVRPANWDRMTEVERSEWIGVPPPGYTEDDAMDIGHPGHPANYG